MTKLTLKYYLFYFVLLKVSGTFSEDQYLTTTCPKYKCGPQSHYSGDLVPKDDELVLEQENSADSLLDQQTTTLVIELSQSLQTKDSFSMDLLTEPHETTETPKQSKKGQHHHSTSHLQIFFFVIFGPIAILLVCVIIMETYKGFATNPNKFCDFFINPSRNLWYSIIENTFITRTAQMIERFMTSIARVCRVTRRTSVNESFGMVDTLHSSYSPLADETSSCGLTISSTSFIHDVSFFFFL